MEKSIDIPYTKEQWFNAAKILYKLNEELKAENAKLKKQIDDLESKYRYCDPYALPAIGAPNDW